MLISLACFQFRTMRSKSRTERMLKAFLSIITNLGVKNGKRKVQGVPQSQTATLPRRQEEEETDKPKQAQIEQMHEKALRLALSSPSEVIPILKGLKNTRTK